MVFVLRDYQEECVQRIINAYKENPGRQELLILPTGAGKTVVFSMVIDTLAREYGTIALVIAHRQNRCKS